MVLLEVMLGTAILGIAGVALVTLLAQTIATLQHGRSVEHETIAASRILDRTSLWSDAELALRLGRSRVGDWDVEITLARPRLWDVAVLDTLSGAPILRTTIYRPEPLRAP